MSSQLLPESPCRTVGRVSNDNSAQHARTGAPRFARTRVVLARWRHVPFHAERIGDGDERVHVRWPRTAEEVSSRIGRTVIRIVARRVGVSPTATGARDLESLDKRTRSPAITTAARTPKEHCISEREPLRSRALFARSIATMSPTLIATSRMALIAGNSLESSSHAIAR
jgi:hypothetical protein